MPSEAATRGASGRPDLVGGLAARIALRVRLRVLLAAAALAIAAAAAGTLIPLDDEAHRPGVPFEASVEDLREAAAKAGRPIYWAGTGPGTRLELTETKAGKTFVHYLPHGVAVADKHPAYLTVASYPYPRTNAATDESSRKRTMVRARTLKGGLAVWSKKRPSNVYLAYPGSDDLVEIFSPGGVLGQRLVLAGKVSAVGDRSSPMPVPRRSARPPGLGR